MVDIRDSKSRDSDIMRVRVSPAAHKQKTAPGQADLLTRLVPSQQENSKWILPSNRSSRNSSGHLRPILMYYFSTKPVRNVVEVRLLASMPIWDRPISMTTTSISAQTRTASSFSITKATLEASAVGPMMKKEDVASADDQFN